MRHFGCFHWCSAGPVSRRQVPTHNILTGIRPTGFEPVTFGSVDRLPNLLSLRIEKHLRTQNTTTWRCTWRRLRKNTPDSARPYVLNSWGQFNIVLLQGLVHDAEIFYGEVKLMKRVPILFLVLPGFLCLNCKTIRQGVMSFFSPNDCRRAVRYPV